MDLKLDGTKIVELVTEVSFNCRLSDMDESPKWFCLFDYSGVDIEDLVKLAEGGANSGRVQAQGYLRALYTTAVEFKRAATHSATEPIVIKVAELLTPKKRGGGVSKSATVLATLRPLRGKLPDDQLVNTARVQLPDLSIEAIRMGLGLESKAA